MQRRKIYTKITLLYTNACGIWLSGLNFKRGSFIYNSTIDIEYEKSYNGFTQKCSKKYDEQNEQFEIEGTIL